MSSEINQCLPFRRDLQPDDQSSAANAYRHTLQYNQDDLSEEVRKLRKDAKSTYNRLRVMISDRGLKSIDISTRCSDLLLVSRESQHRHWVKGKRIYTNNSSSSVALFFFCLASFHLVIIPMEGSASLEKSFPYWRLLKRSYEKGNVPSAKMPNSSRT